LLSFVVLSVAVLVGVAAAVTALLVVGKTEIHENRYYYQHRYCQEHKASVRKLLRWIQHEKFFRSSFIYQSRGICYNNELNVLIFLPYHRPEVF
jgi:hypothetical protein